MTPTRAVTNVVLAGLGGQGIVKGSDVLAQAMFLAGYDVKKSEVHGMSQRGGSVRSEVRFGDRVLSPMVSAGTAHFLLVLEPSQVEPNRRMLAPDGVLITSADLDSAALSSHKGLNIALLALLSRQLDVEERFWHDALRGQLKPATLAPNLELFSRIRRA
jgi:indolepyruvate ferredoxin oxidoreductase, beta subunit